MDHSVRLERTYRKKVPVSQRIFMLQTGKPFCNLFVEHSRVPSPIFVFFAKFLYKNAWYTHSITSMDFSQKQRVFQSSVVIIISCQVCNSWVWANLSRCAHQSGHKNPIERLYSSIQHLQCFFCPRPPLLSFDYINKSPLYRTVS